MRRFKVFAAGIKHESHSFCPIAADLEQFKAGKGQLGYKRDAEIAAVFRGTRSEWGAIFDLADERDWTVIHPLDASTCPAGPVPEETFEFLSAVVMDSLRRACPVDGVFLTLHGAMVTTHLDDSEGELVRRVRSIVGRHVPIAVTLDPHANVAPALAELADIISAYRTTPHVDIYETAMRVGQLLHRVMLREIRPSIVYAQRPMFDGLDGGRTIAGYGPMVELLSMADEFAGADPELLDIAVCAGFNWADKYNVGPSVLVTTNGDRARAQHVADTLIAEAWERRTRKTIEYFPVNKVIDIACAPSNDPRPLLIGDATDCPMAGSTGDCVGLLAAMIEAGVQRAGFAPVADAEAARTARAAGVGANISLPLGGKLYPRFGGGPLHITGTVRAVSDGAIRRTGVFLTGTVYNFGPSAMVEVGGTSVIISSERAQIDDREQFRAFGIVPEEMNILACKSINHFRADFEPIARGLVYADSGGICSHDYQQFPYVRARRPIWPLDEL